MCTGASDNWRLAPAIGNTFVYIEVLLLTGDLCELDCVSVSLPNAREWFCTACVSVYATRHVMDWSGCALLFTHALLALLSHCHIRACVQRATCHSVNDKYPIASRGSDLG